MLSNSHRRWAVFWIISAHYLIGYFHRVAPAVVAPELIRTFGISGAALGVLASTYFYAYAAMQIPVGILADSWGVKKTVMAFAALAAAGGIAFGLSPTFGAAIAARIAVGLGVSAFFVCAMKLFTNWFKGSEYARISGLFLAVGGAGWLFATTPLAFTAQHLGWRAAFLCIGGLGLLLVVCTHFWLSDTPCDGPFPSPDESCVGKRPARRDLKEAFALVLTSRQFWTMVIWSFCTNGIQFGFLGLWAGPYLMDVYGLSKPAAGSVLAMVAFAMIIGAPFLGFLSDRVLESRKKVLVASSLTLSLCWAAMAAGHGNFTFGTLCAIFFLMGLTSSAIGTIGATVAKELFPIEMAGVSVGTLNLFPFAAGMLFQPLIGMILDLSGAVSAYPPSAYVPVLWIFLAVSIVAFLSALCLKETRR